MLEFRKILDFCRKPGFILGTILVVFFLKGLVFALLIPVFQGADEYVHYATVQYLAEPKEKNWPIEENRKSVDSTKKIPDYNYTQEIRELSTLTESWKLSGKPHNTQNFDSAFVKNVEKEMRSGAYQPHMDRYPPTIVPGTQLAHCIGSFIEKAFSDKDFFFRYFSLRFLAIFYGLITLLCAYFIAIWSGFGKKTALLITAIIAFQPMFSATMAIINYDPLLIALSSIFFLSAVSIIVHGLNTKNLSVLIISTALATATKGIGGYLLILAFGTVTWSIRERFSSLKKINLFVFLSVGFLFILLVSSFTSTNYLNIFTKLTPSDNANVSAMQSIGDYLKNDVFDMGKYARTSVTYWGTFGWLDTQLHELVMSFIRFIEYTALFGLLILLVSKWKDFVFFQKIFKRFPKLNYLFEAKDYLPKKQILIFFALSIALLQIAIRFYDWSGIFTAGEGVGTPGRYFFPNIIVHFILFATGLGVFAKSSRAFEVILKIIFLLMVLLCIYSIFLIIIPRYYL